MNFKMDAEVYKMITDFVDKHCKGQNVTFKSDVDGSILIDTQTTIGDRITIRYVPGAEMMPTVTKTVRIGDYK